MRLPFAATATAPIPLLVMLVTVMPALLEGILSFAPHECTGQGTNDAMTCFVSQESTSYTPSDGTHEAALSFLWLGWVGRVLGKAVWVVWVAALR